MSWDVFISHSSEDIREARQLKNLLEEAGITCWIDDKNIRGGEDFTEDIVDAIRDCSVVVVLLSKIAQKKSWVKKEIIKALKYKEQNGRPEVLPIMIDGYLDDSFDFATGDVQRYDLRRNGYAAIERMIEDIKRIVGNNNATNISSKQKNYWEGFRKKYNRKTIALKILNIILWVLFFPVMLMIKVCRSKNFGMAVKIILCVLLFQLALIWLSMWTFGIGYLASNPDDRAIGMTSQSRIELDIEELAAPLIKGYNNFGYFDGTVSRDGTFDTNDGKFSYTLRFAEFKDGAAYFDISVDKDGSPMGDAVITAECNEFLSNDEILEFVVSEKIDGCDIKLNNSKFRISTLDSGEFERSDPKEYFVLNKVRTIEEGLGIPCCRFEILNSEYVVGTKTVKLSVIEDKRSGAEYVQPGLQFEVYEDGNLLGQGRYIFKVRNGTTSVKYHADFDDYEVSFPELAPDFDQAKLLDQTGILFNFESKEYHDLG